MNLFNSCFKFYFEEKWKPSKCSIEDIFRAVQLCLEAAMIEPVTQSSGAICIFDFDGLSLTHVMQFSPNIAMMILDWIQDCIPLRLKGIHMVNNSYFFNMVFAIFKPFIREKLRKRVSTKNFVSTYNIWILIQWKIIFCSLDSLP